jgi:hypothetical protein
MVNGCFIPLGHARQFKPRLTCRFTAKPQSSQSGAKGNWLSEKILPCFAFLCALCGFAVRSWQLLALPHPVTPGSGARKRIGTTTERSEIDEHFISDNESNGQDGHRFTRCYNHGWFHPTDERRDRHTFLMICVYLRSSAVPFSHLGSIVAPRQRGSDLIELPDHRCRRRHVSCGSG